MTKNIKWVDINEPKKKYNFTPLVNESSPKGNVNSTDQLKETTYWKDFKAKGQLIGKILGVDEGKVSQELDNFGETLAQLGETGDAEGGIREVSVLEQRLEKIDFGQEGLSPKIDINLFLNLVGDGRVDSIRTIKSLIDTRKSRNLAGYLNGAGKKVFTISLAGIFSKVGEKIREKEENIYRAFNGLVKLSNFKKSNNPVGPGEIAMALAFNDCKLAGEQGDIETGTERTHVEVKSSQGSITQRFSGNENTIQHELIMQNPKTWGRMADEVGNMPKKDIVQLITKYDTSMNAFNAKRIDWTIQERGILFAYMFGKTFIEYAYKESHFDKIVLVNTQNELSLEQARLAVFEKPDNVTNKYGIYEVGRSFLDDAKEQNVNIWVASRANGQYCFKIGFLVGSGKK